MRALVIGGGIAGLATAISLRQAGIDSFVIERTAELKPVGAGINLAANALKALVSLGADAHVRELGVAGEQELYLDIATGQRIARRQLLGEPAARRYGERYFSLHRADLMDALLAQVRPDQLMLGATMVDAEEKPDGVITRLSDGSTVEGDFLVGADGLRSLIRGQLFGAEDPTFMGTQGWRALFPRSSLPAHLPPAEGLSAWIGMGLTVSMYPIRKDLMYAGAFVPSQEVNEESWTSEGGIDQLRAAVRGACADVQHLVDAIEASAETVFLTSLYYRDPLPTWTRGRMTLLGDAAHPTPPGAGQGAAMALEDAVTLGLAFRRNPSDISRALAEYEARRVPRTRRVMETALAIQRFVADSDPLLISARNGRMRGLERLDPFGATTFGWIASYDARAAFDEPKDTRPGTPVRNRPVAREAVGALRDALTTDERSRGWAAERAGFERFVTSLAGDRRESAPAEPPRPVDMAGVPGLLVGGADEAIVLHVHGGGFTMGSAAASARLAARLAAATSGTVALPDYRLGPEYPYPAAVDDVEAAYRWLAAEFPGRRIVLSAECAGAAPALATAVRLRDAGEPPPAGLCLVSPFVDLTLSAGSIDRNGVQDGWFNRDTLTYAAASYLHDADPAHPEVSPLFADLRGLPPLLIHAASDEALYDDAVRLAAAAGEQGVTATLVTVDDSVHSFTLHEALPESGRALAEQAKFIREAGR